MKWLRKWNQRNENLNFSLVHSYCFDKFNWREKEEEKKRWTNEELKEENKTLTINWSILFIYTYIISSENSFSFVCVSCKIELIMMNKEFNVVIRFQVLPPLFSISIEFMGWKRENGWHEPANCKLQIVVMLFCFVLDSCIASKSIQKIAWIPIWNLFDFFYPFQKSKRIQWFKLICVQHQTINNKNNCVREYWFRLRYSVKFWFFFHLSSNAPEYIYVKLIRIHTANVQLWLWFRIPPINQ